MKRILDTVHGYIMVPDEYIHHIIDTIYFQRLRRIEQTSIRSVYPSARHDRFIHSLGVFHIGSLILDHLQKEAQTYDYWGETQTTLMVIGHSYLAACLLHDIAHAPFSHTFEKYYGKRTDLAELLAEAVNNDSFTEDLKTARGVDEPNFHEYMSAYLAYVEYISALKRMNLNAELVVRMITGVLYKKEESTHQLHNCFISLLHGKVIDADRLDYACRDVWASGYSTSTIDLRRLISGLHIECNPEDKGKYIVCFESNCLNEIEGVLNVKDFQVKYVLNHHSVNYEQWLLVHAAEHMAWHFFPDDENTYNAMHRIICKESLVGEVKIPNTNCVIKNLSDDDLIFLMKQDKDNKYYQEWCSRQYSCFPLWKSPDEFYHCFRGLKRTKSLQHKDFRKVVEGVLMQQFKIDPSSVIVSEAKYKPRVKMDELHLVVSKEVVKYIDIHPEAKWENENVTFYYVFVPKKENESKQDQNIRKRKIINSLRPFIETLYQEK